MEKQKEETLAKLYTLRAGLSFIAQQHDYCKKVVADEEAYTSKLAKDLSDTPAAQNELIGQIMDEISKDPNGNKNASKIFESHIKRLKYSVSDNNNAIEYHNRKLRKSLIWIILYGVALAAVGLVWAILIFQHGKTIPFDIAGSQKGQLIAVSICAPISLIAGIVFMLTTIRAVGDGDFDGNYLLGGLVICGIPFLVCIIVTIYFGINLFHKNIALIVLFFVIYLMIALYPLLILAREHIKSNIGYTKKRKTNYENDIRDCEQFLKDYLVEIKKTDESGKASLKKIEEPIKLSRLMYEVLEEEFGEFLNPSDWQYLDYIIFYYETGRADSIKESLQLADNERRMNTLANSIKKASDEISNNINRGLAAIRDDMSTAFNAVSERVNSLAGEMSDLRSTANSLISSAQMNSALISSASSGSQQLMDDVHQLRTLADNEEIRRRNGQ